MGIGRTLARHVMQARRAEVAAFAALRIVSLSPPLPPPPSPPPPFCLARLSQPDPALWRLRHPAAFEQVSTIPRRARHLRLLEKAPWSLPQRCWKQLFAARNYPPVRLFAFAQAARLSAFALLPV
ncbi:hypothetical protein FA95DRAFT_1012738 [Auriscalpium vulgare]|uniref:Uncharacterized protein n=1 Tax=Auriscalpium vulgare TaxID=40419 RepID=A0ACB8R690_9AGAM|nr:hypothetical protein FA95DRAFT_1012738 [Auriscalpium vulgare]